MLKVKFAWTARQAVQIAADAAQHGQGWVLAIWPIVIVWRRK
jgi:hypothetical protein